MDLQRYTRTIEMLDNSYDDIITEMSFIQQMFTTVLGNYQYMIKDKDTQAIFESVLIKNQKKMAPNNHQKGYDFKHAGNQISVKSGTISGNKLKLSYSRTTEYPTLEEKLDYLSTFENLIIGIASEKVKSKNPNIISKVRYFLYYFPANAINFKEMQWEENSNQYTGVDPITGMHVEIKRKMSDQPWITIPIDKIHCVPLITATVSNHRNHKYLMIKNPSGERSYYDIYEHRKQLKAMKGLQKCSAYTIKAATV